MDKAGKLQSQQEWERIHLFLMLLFATRARRKALALIFLILSVCVPFFFLEPSASKAVQKVLQES